MWDPRQDAWLAGFAEGEGCFSVASSGSSKQRREALVPRFAIGVHACEVGLLRRLADAFGGSVCLSYANDPRCTWTVVAKRDLECLAAYLDRFPLRGAKARDYAIWREAVRLYCGTAKPAWTLLDQMSVLDGALRGVRRETRAAALRRVV